MHDQCALLLPFESFGKQRPCRRSMGPFNRHRQKSGWFVENDHGIVFVKHGKLTGETRPAPVFLGRHPIRLCGTAASLSRKLFHWLSV